MIYPTIGDLTKKAGSRYSLVIAASKRARQIALESENTDEPIDGAKSITQAVNEIADEMVKIIPPENLEDHSIDEIEEKVAEYYAQQ